ncbi:MAG: hypothetical protein WKG01_31965, partial [Kofleriaceae bacterium]
DCTAFIFDHIYFITDLPAPPGVAENLSVACKKNRATRAAGGPTGAPIMGHELEHAPQPAVKPAAAPLYKEEEGADHDDGPTDAVFKDVSAQVPRKKKDGKSYEATRSADLPKGGPEQKKSLDSANKASSRALDVALRRATNVVYETAIKVKKYVDTYAANNKKAEDPRGPGFHLMLVQQMVTEGTTKARVQDFAEIPLGINLDKLPVVPAGELLGALDALDTELQAATLVLTPDAALKAELKLTRDEVSRYRKVVFLLTNVLKPGVWNPVRQVTNPERLRGDSLRAEHVRETLNAAYETVHALRLEMNGDTETSQKATRVEAAVKTALVHIKFLVRGNDLKKLDKKHAPALARLHAELTALEADPAPKLDTESAWKTLLHLANLIPGKPGHK